MILITSLWTLWGVGELYYEGWGLPFPYPILYLIPGWLCLLLTLAVLTWPRLFGWVLIAVGIIFTVGWWFLMIQRNGFSWRTMVSTFLVSGLMAVAGYLFLLEGRYRQKKSTSQGLSSINPFHRHLPYLAAVGLPLLIVMGVSAFHLPRLLTRLDDGERGARRIIGNGVRLIWAPLGPGWNWKQSWGGYPSWNQLAWYGEPPVGLKEKPGQFASRIEMQSTGLCAYLNEQGTELMEIPQYIWRMPTVDEIARSFTRNGENAACTWDGIAERLDCWQEPDKETPLWAPDMEPIYYWAADEFNAEEAYYVSYNGQVYAQPKDWGNPRHGYRCVRAADSP